ncbi:MAG: VWA domain-containing protein [Alcanivoracaceae bacterium]|nr:VWA domain-containing protein [Alcanivoracaceae bacterium]
MKKFILMCACLISSQIMANDKAIIVLDASGSMWGQIDGKTKIEMAKEVFTDLVSDWDENIDLGVTVYGHRSKGDCNDIESVYPVSPIDRKKLNTIIQAIVPKGKTPLSKAVQLAAEELKYTEDKATVILISDGKESCHLNPCEVAKKLESSGIEFTAHVIGFDVDEETKKELSCMATSTGGQYFDAHNAEELRHALKEVAKFPDTIDLIAKEKETNKELKNIASFTFTHIESNKSINIYGTASHTKVAFDIEGKNGVFPGRWNVKAHSGFYQADQELTITDDLKQEIIVYFDNTRPKVTLKAPDKVSRATVIEVTWESDKTLTGRIIIVNQAAEYSDYGESHAYVDKKNSVAIQIPAKVGEYELRYVKNNQTIASHALSVVDSDLAIITEDSVIGGTELQIALVNPENIKGMIIITQENKQSSDYGLNHIYVQPDREQKIRVPSEKGMYDLKWLSSKNELLASKRIEITDAQVSLIAKETAIAGTMLTIGLNAPEGLDGLVIIESPQQNSDYGLAHAYAKNKKKVELRAPIQEGDYVLRWKNGLGGLVTEKAIKITPEQASFNSPNLAYVATTISINVNSAQDYKGTVVIDNKDAKVNAYGLSHTYANKNNNLELKLTGKAGEYEIRWISPTKHILHKENITLLPAELSIDIPSTVTASENFEVKWTSNVKYNGSFVIQKPSKAVDIYGLSHAYSNDSNSTKIKAPEQKGTYEIRWVTKDKVVLAKAVFEVR